MKSIIQKIKAFRKDEKGVTLIEYGLLASLITVLCLVSITTIGTKVQAAFVAIAAAFK